MRTVSYSEMFHVCENVPSAFREDCHQSRDYRVSEIAEQNRNPLLCNDIDDIRDKDACYFNSAIRAKDSSFCAYVTGIGFVGGGDEMTKKIKVSHCVYAATKKEDLKISICDNIPYTELNSGGINQIKNNCYQDLAVILRDIKICDNIDINKGPKTDRYWCQAAVRKSIETIEN